MWFDARVRGVIRRQQRSSALIDLTVARGKRVVRCSYPAVNAEHECNNTTSVVKPHPSLSNNDMVAEMRDVPSRETASS